MDAVINYQNSYEKRSRDLDILRYLFRSIEKNANVFDRIFVVCDFKTSMPPKWLDTSKVFLVSHEDFIPEAFLPTFNQHVVEMFMYHIPGLSNDFVYIQEDTIFMNKCIESNFFIDGKVVIKQLDDFDREDIYKFGSYKMHSDLMYYIKNGEGVENIIVPEIGAIPMDKSFNFSVVKRFSNLLEQIEHMYEKNSDVNYSIFPIGMILSDNSIPGTNREILQLDKYTLNEVDSILRQTDSNVMCIDSNNINDETLFLMYKNKVIDCLGSIFNEPSSFEVE